MDDKMRRQLEKILEKAEAKDRERTLAFFEKIKSVGSPSEQDRLWFLEQFRILAKVVKLSGEGNMVLALNLFTMGRAYERYYAPKIGYSGGAKHAC